MTSKAQKNASLKYDHEKIDRVYLRVPKGKKDIIQAIADSKNESINALINRLIDEEILKNNAKLTLFVAD